MIPAIPNNSQLLAATAARRIIPAEIAEINRLLAQPMPQDQMTAAIREWANGLTASLLQNDNPNAVIQAYIPLLRQILMNPLLALDIYNHPERRMEPHPIVNHMIGWLRAHNAAPSADEVEQAYRQFAPPPPPSRRERRLQALAAHEERKESPEMQEFMAELNRAAQEIPAALERAAQEERRLIEESSARREAMLQAAREEDVAAVQIIDGLLQILESEVQSLTLEIEGLHRDIQRNRGKITETERQTRELQIAVRETEKIIKEREKSGIKQLGKTVLMIGAAVFATWAIATLLAELPAAIAVLPVQGGGFKVMAASFI